MIEQFLLALPMATVVIGAFVLMLLSTSKSFNLERLNLVAVFFLLLSLLFQYFTFKIASKEFQERILAKTKS